MKKLLTLVLCVVLLCSCSVFSKKKDDKGKADAVDVMYNDGMDKLSNGRYEPAIDRFEEVERTYPYSQWAIKSQVMAAYASYKNENYDKALVTLERFTKLHPGNKDVPYAYYLKALSFYEQISDVGRDQSYSQYAKEALKEVIARFPTSKYAKDARIKLDLVNDHLAGKEVEIGRFYLKRGNHIGAINRFQKVIKEYDTTSHVPEALYRLVEANLLLGLRDEATKYAAVLGYNFPENKWYKRAYELLEGHKLRGETDEEKKGKWYDFKGWNGLTFDKVKIFGKDKPEDKSKKLIDDLDPTVGIDRSVEEQDAPALGEEDPEEDQAQEAPAGAKKSGIKGWFERLKLPFMKD